MSGKNENAASCSTGRGPNHEKPACSKSKINPTPISVANNVPKNNVPISSLIPADKMKSLIMGNSDFIRVPSLVAPRDLTLSGTKKTYAPNLNVKRNKNLNVKTSKDTTRGGRGGKVDKGDRGRGGGRGGRGGGRGGRGGANLIQTTGIFSEGAGAPMVKKPSSYSTRINAEESSSTITRPIINKTAKTNESLLNKTEAPPPIVDDKGEEEDFFADRPNTHDLPVILKRGPIEKKAKETATKEAPTTSHGHRHDYGKFPKALQSIFESPEPMSFIMQLPDALPFEGCDLIYDETTKDEESVKSNLKTTKPLPKAVPISRLGDGQIGKLVRYRSGRVKLMLGNNSFEIISGMGSNITQQLMSISMKEGEAPRLIQLGSINAKVTAVPDWKTMLREQDSKMNLTTD